MSPVLGLFVVTFVQEFSMYVCLPLRLLLIAISVMWHDMDKFYSFYMADVVNIVSRHGHRIETHQRNKIKLPLYLPLLSF